MMNNNEITQVQELLKSVGLNTFINYYYDFQQNLSIEDLLSLFDKNENIPLLLKRKVCLTEHQEVMSFSFVPFFSVFNHFQLAVVGVFVFPYGFH